MSFGNDKKNNNIDKPQKIIQKVQISLTIASPKYLVRN